MLGRVERYDPSLLVDGEQAEASSFAAGCSAVTIVGALYDALDAGVTVTAEYEGPRGRGLGDRAGWRSNFDGGDTW